MQWVSWYEQCLVKKMACTPQQIKHTPQNWQAPNFISMDYVKLTACQFWGVSVNKHIKTCPF
jgi:hypothetical protein